MHSSKVTPSGCPDTSFDMRCSTLRLVRKMRTGADSRCAEWLGRGGCHYAGGYTPAALDAPATATTGLAAAGVGALAMVAVPAGLSGPPSTAGSVPATAETLQAELREMFRPDQEPVADYLTRIARIVLALRAHGVAISSGELDMLTTKASLLAEEFGRVGGGWSGVCSRKGTTAMPPKSR